MKIGQKLILGFLSVAIMVGVVGYISIASNKNTGKFFEFSTKVEIPELIATMEMESASRQASIKAIEYSLRGNQRDKTKTFEALDKLDTSINNMKKISLIEIPINEESPNDKAKIQEISNKIDKFKTLIKEYIALKDKELPLEKLFFKEEEIHQARNQLIHLLYERKEHELKELSEYIALTNT